ncbi:MAG: glycogen debranching enzyme, partial [Zetaproteobacteria bacterium]
MNDSGPNDCQPGSPAPLGATVEPGSVNFAVYAKQATTVELLLFDAPSAPAPSVVHRLDPRLNRTGPYWHLRVPGAGHGQVYGWRVDGPQDPAAGLLYDGDKLLVDPYARAVVGQDIYDRRA